MCHFQFHSRRVCVRAVVFSLVTAAPLMAGVTMTPLTSFGGSDGWRAPGEILPGDAAGSNNGTTYNYLGAANLERGMAYCPQHEQLILLSRNGGVNIRQLNPLTGVDLGALSTGTGIITGGTFAASTVACDDNGAIYAANLTSGGSTVRIYRWEEPSSEPVLFFETPVTDYSPTPRFGDCLDVFYANSAPVLLLGGGNNTPGYLVVENNSATKVKTFSPSGVNTADFRLGVTFGPDGQADVWGRTNAGTAARRTAYTSGSTAGSFTGNAALTATAEVGMDVIRIGTLPLLATCEFNNSATALPRVRVYDTTDPAAPALVATGTSASAPQTANSNGVGSIKWGKITEAAGVTTVQLYAMSTNHGIQAFDVTVTPDVTPPSIASSPASRTVFARGQTTFTASATGTPPLSYQWLKGNVEIPGATAASYTIDPVSAESAGDYVCRVSNAAAPPAETTAATLTVEAGPDTSALTTVWRLKPGDRTYLTEGDFQRGLALNATTGRLYLASRASAASATVQVLDAANGDDLGALEMSGISGGQFVLNLLGVAGDGAIYGCNLSNTDGTGFKIYQWPDDQPGTFPGDVYNGNPASLRIGDSFAVRGSGNGTQIVAGTNAAGVGPGAHFALFTKNDGGFFDMHPINVPGAADRAFSLGIGFGPNNTIWGKGNGTGVTVATLTYNAEAFPPWSAALLSVIPNSAIPTAGGAIAVDEASGALAHIHTGNSDNLRLYRLPALAPPPVTMEWLDQEFFLTDNANLNATGQAVFGGGKLYALDTNNGLICCSVTVPPPPAPPPVITQVAQSGGSVVFTLKATVGKTYIIEKSTQLDPIATWSADGTVTVDEAEEIITRSIPAGTPRLYYRAREQQIVVAP
jgi:Immunoglobulin domain